MAEDGRSRRMRFYNTIYTSMANKSHVFYEVGNSFEGTSETERTPDDSYVAMILP